MKRKRRTNPGGNRWEFPPDVWPLGGHMYRPPEDCKRPDMIRNAEEHGTWIDVNICSGFCPKPCEQFLRFRKTWKHGRK